MESENITHQLVLIAGGSSTIGLGIVHKLLFKGAKVLFPSCNRKKFKKIMEDVLDSELPRLFLVDADFSTEEGVQKINEVIEKHGPLKHIISVLGSWHQDGPVTKQSFERFNEVMYDICGCNFLLAKNFLDKIRNVEGSTYTIFTGISAEHLVHPDTGLLTIGESALHGLVLALQAETKDDPVRVNEYRLGLAVREDDKLEQDREDMVSNRVIGRDFYSKILMNKTVKGSLICTKRREDVNVEWRR